MKPANLIGVMTIGIEMSRMLARQRYQCLLPSCRLLLVGGPIEAGIDAARSERACASHGQRSAWRWRQRHVCVSNRPASSASKRRGRNI